MLGFIFCLGLIFREITVGGEVVKFQTAQVKNGVKIHNSEGCHENSMTKDVKALIKVCDVW